ncbi:MAG: DUF4167 domain-containing protein [Rhodospirillaceae bacterium]|nr:DUF4167 domain-containing protein [Rhodospirillaceae bacterium]
MRQNTNQRRGRGRNNQNRRPGRNQSFDSNGPSVRLRGTAAQLNEKYQALARDATSAGDRVMAENYHQHADHYYRVMISLNPPQTREEDRQPDLADGDEIQPLDGRARGDRGQNQSGQNQRAQNQGSQNPDRPDRQDRQDRRDNRNRRGRDRQEDGEAPPAETGQETAADGKPGAEGETRGRTRRQPVRRQDSDPRRRSGGRADEAVPGDEPLDQGLHRILGGGPEKAGKDGAAADPAGDDAVSAAASGDAASGDDASGSGLSGDGASGGGAGEDMAAGNAPGPDAAADAAAPAEETPKPRTRRRKPAAEPEEAAPAEPVADATV